MNYIECFRIIARYRTVIARQVYIRDRTTLRGRR
jgi:hypothetical protein